MKAERHGSEWWRTVRYAIASNARTIRLVMIIVVVVSAYAVTIRI